MRKFAANYVVSEAGVFLKNGILIVSDDGTGVEYVDTKGDLNEIERLSFHNGILLTGFRFVKINKVLPVFNPDARISSIVGSNVDGIEEVSILKWVEIGKQVQEQFPEMKIPEIMNEIKEVLLSNGGYSKEIIPGIFLLIGINLVQLRYTPKSRLKKIL